VAIIVDIILLLQPLESQLIPTWISPHYIPPPSHCSGTTKQ